MLHLLVETRDSSDKEWGYAFDVHLNAIYLPLVMLHVIQLFSLTMVSYQTQFFKYLVGNTLWLIAVGY